MTLFRVIDFETTGLDERAGVVEVGWVDCVRGDAGLDIGEPKSVLTNPNKPIGVEAMAVHHITDADIAGAISVGQAFLMISDGADYFVAHNARFERQFFTGGERPWICTYRCALHLWPEAVGHSNQVLRYWLGLLVGDPRAALAHRAGADALVTAAIFGEMLKLKTPDELVKLSRKAAVLHTCRFGKHAGTLWRDVPVSYLSWIVEKSGMDDPDVLATARHFLKVQS